MRVRENLILIRHGQSEWNAQNRFTGWVDVALNDTGRAEAVSCGAQLAEADLAPDVAHTSLLRRSITTADLVLHEVGRHWIPVRRSWRLNERHYGALQGMNRKETLAEFGEDQFMDWRRSFDVRAPSLSEEARRLQMDDPRYAHLGHTAPHGESLKDVLARVLPYWERAIAPDLRNGATVLVVAHGNTIRALVKHLDRLSDDDIVALNIPTGIPLLYALDGNLTPVTPGGRYLDPVRAVVAAKAVADEGR